MTAVLGMSLLASPASAAESYPELTAESLAASDFTLYFANAGATVVDSVAAGDHMGLYQTVTDQPYGPDAATGQSWGFVVDGTSNPVARDSTGNEKLASLRYDSEPSGATLSSRQVTYSFDLPAGTYDVTFGFAAPSSWGGRQVVTMAEGAALEAPFSAGTTALEKNYPAVVVNDGTLDLAVASPADRTSGGADPLVNYILVRAVPEWTTGLLEAKIGLATLTDDEAAGYAQDSVASLRSVLADAQALVEAGATDASAIEAAYLAISAAWDALRPVVTYDSFRPGEPWLDTDGQVIQAHGGQVVAATDDQGSAIWYWYGEDRSNGYYNSPGVHVYSSYDLYNW